MEIKKCNLIKGLTSKADETILEIAKRLKENKARSTVILDDKSSPAGIVSLVDINNKVVAENKDVSKTLAKDIMTAPIKTADAKDDVETAYCEMTKTNTFSIPITENGKFAGVLTLNEALKYIIKEKRETLCKNV